MFFRISIQFSSSRCSWEGHMHSSLALFFKKETYLLFAHNINTSDFRLTFLGKDFWFRHFNLPQIPPEKLEFFYFNKKWFHFSFSTFSIRSVKSTVKYHTYRSPLSPMEFTHFFNTALYTPFLTSHYLNLSLCIHIYSLNK